MPVNQFYTGDTVVFNIEIRNSDGDLVDPDSIVITISSNAILVNNQPMSKSAVGTYYYNWIAIGSGKYTAKYIASDYGRISSARDIINIIN